MKVLGWLAVAGLILISRTSNKQTPSGNYTADFGPNEFIPPNDRETIPKGAADSLRALAVNVLQPARNALRLPIRINSAYRNPQRNAAIGGVLNSQHITGQAVDIQPIPATRENFKKLNDIIVRNGKYDQIIWENALAFSETPSHLHVSFVVPGLNANSIYQVNRKRRLQYKNRNYTVIV